MDVDTPRGLVLTSSARVAGALLTLLALALPSPTAAAQSTPVKVGDVQGRVESPWPSAVQGGYFPLFFELENTAARPRVFTVRASRGRGLDEITKSFALGAREKIRGEMVVPGFDLALDDRGSFGPAGFTVECDDGSESQTLANIGPREPDGSHLRSVVVVSQDPLAPGATAVLADGLGWAGQRSTGTTTKNVRVGAVTFNEMPRRNEAYSSLGAVIVKLDNGLPDAAALAPLLAWARLGGSLVLVGPRAETLAASTPGIREWLESRFVLERDAISLSAILGLGRLHVLNGELDMGSLSTSSTIVSWLRVAQGSVPKLTSATTQAFDPGPAVKPSIPMRPLVAGLVGFVILVGPVNFIRAKRRGKSITLLVSIPLFSVAAFVALIAFGLWHQGLDTKVKSHSYALLDQRAHVSSSVENRTVYAGWIGGSGLRPGAGTSVYPAPRPVRTNVSPFGRRSLDLGDAFRIDYDGETRLTGEFLPPRRSVAQSILTDRPTRLRLSIERKGPELLVNNGLGARVRRLWVFDTRGTCHALRQADPLEIGATASLTEAANPDLDRHYNRVWHASGIVPCTFAAVLTENPFGDACGVNTTETSGYHYMVGVLDEKEENWK